MRNHSQKILAMTGSIRPGSTSQYIEAAKGRLDSAGMITDKQLEAYLDSLIEAFAGRMAASSAGPRPVDALT
ncbi:hypothetical protein [Dyadobacter bucti]|uniref:hypothetical protein n=1 Tax=Dyadobacter bucti TaxID=2572203 RepID=UPI0011083434|nr:hypothetical protein [Dyadobacter bucti]